MICTGRYPHLFRHFDAMLYLADNPGGYEVNDICGKNGGETAFHRNPPSQEV